jgi:triphosphatase
MPNNQEVEIKLRVNSEEIGTLTSLDVLGDVKPEQMHFRTIYFDDRKHDLARHGFELRVRSDGVRRIQTLKSIGSVDRGEWEAETSQETPSVQKIKKTPARKFIKSNSNLRPVFSLSIDRRTWALSRDGSTVEIALDTGKLEAGGQSQPVHEVELELKAGTPEFLYEVAERMTSAIDAPLCFISKGSYGYRLANGHAAEPEHSLDLRFDDDDPSIESAFQEIADACLRQFSINDECLRIGIERQAIHQARVAIRRLRAAFSMFKDIVVGDDAYQVRKGLKWISDLLGKARDLDVFVDGRLMVIKLEHPDVPGLEELVQKVESKRNDSYNQLQEAIHSGQHRRLFLSALRCVHNGEWMLSNESAISRETSFLDLAKSELDRRFGSVRKNKKAVRGHDALKRHRVRIKAKKLRYMAEFLKPLARKSIRTNLERAKAVTGSIGGAKRRDRRRTFARTGRGRGSEAFRELCRRSDQSTKPLRPTLQ